MAAEAFGRLKTCQAASATISGLRQWRMPSFSPASTLRIAAVAMAVRGHERIEGDPAFELFGHAQHAQAHAVLRHGVGGVGARTSSALHVQRRRKHQHMRVGGFAQSAAHARLETRNVPRALTSMHEVEALHLGRFQVPVREMALALLTQISMPPNFATQAATAVRHLFPETDIAAAPGQRLAARLLDLLRPRCRWFPAVWDWRSVVLAAMAILAPSRAARSAMARPDPRLPPVMNKVFALPATRILPC